MVKGTEPQIWVTGSSAVTSRKLSYHVGMNACPVSFERIVACLNETFGIALMAIEFLPLSHAGETWVFRVATDGAASFIKLKKL